MKRQSAAKQATYAVGFSLGREEGYAQAMKDVAFLAGAEPFTGPLATRRGKHRKQAVEDVLVFLDTLHKDRIQRRAQLRMMLTEAFDKAKKTKRPQC